MSWLGCRFHFILKTEYNAILVFIMNKIYLNMNLEFPSSVPISPTKTNSRLGINNFNNFIWSLMTSYWFHFSTRAVFITAHFTVYSKKYFFTLNSKFWHIFRRIFKKHETYWRDPLKRFIKYPFFFLSFFSLKWLKIYLKTIAF